MSKIENVPRHLALIPDGNRRWSKSKGLKLLRGYSTGIRKFIDFSIWSKEFGIKTLSVWALSTENIRNRSKSELSMFYNLFTKEASDPKILSDLVSNRVRVKVIGDTTMLPAQLKKALRKVEAKTRKFTDLTINLLIGYGGRDDIVHAARMAAMHAVRTGSTSISESDVKANLRTNSIADADLIIRTSGEKRLSGFLPWQSTYSELYFAKKYWPDFSKKDLKLALADYSRRQRRFGR
ncbi:MAG: polyprenyl diphosphate synthase [Candidatus Marsarchaeota archaeon]|nr:polyprenyl diphosphate synthase [Candidatus Marsarchaeota archaeon]MCL5112842.1 polyprenyl diphosphate synthase [Candidatus Marsarchaeota archaeon]